MTPEQKVLNREMEKMMAEVKRRLAPQLAEMMKQRRRAERHIGTTHLG